MRFIVIVCVLLFVAESRSFAQAPTLIFYEVIHDDSLVLFFNQRYKFTEKPCAVFNRYSRIDVHGNFNGYFEDRDQEQKLLGKGQYIEGKKHGYFESYYPNGKLRSKGNFADNVPSGEWAFFYDTGLPERTLKFSRTDTLMIRYIDKKGDITVIEGNGRFDGPVAGIGNGGMVQAEGKILNGKPDGSWKSTVGQNMVYSREKFADGKFIEGVLPNALSGVKNYTNRSFLNTFFLPGYVAILEDFDSQACADSMHNQSKQTFNYQKFYNELGIRIREVVKRESKKGLMDFVIGDNYVTVSFSVDASGKPQKFELVSNWGRQFYNDIVTSLKLNSKFNPAGAPKYFHLKLRFSNGGGYSFTSLFSSDKSTQW